MMACALKPGDWIATVGDAGNRWWLKPVYKAIRAYAKARYAGIPDAITDVTHVRLYIGDGRLFEMTWPKGQFVTLAESELAEKWEAGHVRVARWTRVDINEVVLECQASRYDGKPYDAGDLVDFAAGAVLSGLTGGWAWLIRGGPLRLFGDRARRYGVCSTVAARVLQGAKVPFPPGVSPDSIDPAWPFNQEDTGVDWCPSDITILFSKESFR